MKRLLLILFCCCIAVSMKAQTTAQDTSRQHMPKLEIPEITIVGKKAITLPFARKGEVYDVTVYEAAPPESSLLGKRQSISFPPGSLPLEEERREPFHASAEGTFGSFSTGMLRAYADYTKEQWSFSGNTGFSSTEGHTENAQGTMFDINLNGKTVLHTDNDLLKTMLFSGKGSVSTEQFGMLAFTNIERNRRNFSLDASLSSLDRRGITIDLEMETTFRNITDDTPSGDREVTVVSPLLQSSLSTTLGSVRWRNSLTFSGVSLDYSVPTQSVTLIQFSSAFQWTLNERSNINAGLLYGSGSDALGESHTLVMPTVYFDWNLSPGQALTLWWKPELSLTSYDEHIQYNPYFSREIDIQPERTPINVGVTYSTAQEQISVEAGLAFSQTNNKAVTVANNGLLWLEYVEAVQTKFNLDLSYRPLENFRANISGALQPSFEDGSSEQLPMTPLVKVQAKAEYDLKQPVTLFASFDSWSNQNIDRAATRSLDAVALLGIGASTTIVPRTIVTLNINNLLGTSYDWWERYPAPGLQFLLQARINLR